MTDAPTSSQNFSPHDIACARQDALALLQDTILFDGHNDLPFVIRKDTDGDLAAFAPQEARAGRDTDIARLKAGRVGAQVLAAYVPPHEHNPASYALQQIALVARLCRRHDDDLMPARSCEDIAAAKRTGKIAIVTSIENGACLENRLDALYAYYDLGVRLMTLCHNATTDWCDSATDRARHNGLSPFGLAVVAEMNRLGMMVDLAHVSEAVMAQVLARTKAPVVWSHSNAYAMCHHPRNVSDTVLERVGGNGGIVMATFVPDFICERSRRWSAPLRDAFGRAQHGDDEDAMIARREKDVGAWPRGGLVQYCDQLEYLRAKIGEDHIGIGSDFFGGPQGPGLEDASCFPNIFAELLLRGWDSKTLVKLAGVNFLRVFAAVEAARG